MRGISIKKAALINAVSKYSVVIFSIIFNAILARIVTPDQFGIVAVITVFTNFFGVLADMGIGTAVIQNKELTEYDINHIFTFTIYIGFALGLIFVGVSFLVSDFYENAIYIPLGGMLCFSLLFSAFNMVPNALMLKEKRFVSVSIRTISACLTSSILATVLALNNWGCYALVLQSIVNNAVIFIWNYFSTRPQFTIKIDLKCINKIKSYSAFQFMFSCVNYFSRNLDNLLVSRFMGDATLGYYDKAYKLTLYPTNNLTHVITPVLHPILSEYQSNKKYIYIKYLEVLRILSLLGILITPICFFCRNEIILIVFGDRWAKAIDCFGCLALSIWAQMLASSSGSIFQSIGKTKLLFKQGLITSGITIVCILIGVFSQNILLVSCLVAFAYNVNFFIVFYILIKYGFGYSFLSFLRSFRIDAAIFVCLLIEGILINVLLPYYKLNIVIGLMLKVILYLILYCVLVRLFGQHRLFINLIKRKR